VLVVGVEDALVLATPVTFSGKNMEGLVGSGGRPFTRVAEGAVKLVAPVYPYAGSLGVGWACAALPYREKHRAHETSLSLLREGTTC
jgi:hypothetical protein